MKLKTTQETETRIARAWYIKYPFDAYAMGPYRYNDLVPATKVIEDAERQFGEKPCEVWPEGRTEEVEEYEIELDIPDDEE